MTAARSHLPNAAISHQVSQPLAPSEHRHSHRERDFGIGYGNSSGYGRDKRYVRDWGQGLFRFR